MVSYKQLIKNALFGKPFRTARGVFSTYLRNPKTGMPFKLKFECSSICNLRCKMCPLHIGLNRKQGFLRFENFKKVFDEINPAYLNLTGIGEPFLNKDIFKIIKYAREKRVVVKFDTNAVLLNKDNINKILDTKISIISISIDGTDKKSYESIRIGSNFDLIKKNVKNLVNERNRLKSKTEIHMFFVLQKNNIEKLPEFIKLANELGVDYAAGSFVVDLGKNTNKENKLLNYNKEKILKIIKETEELIKTTNTIISVDPLLEYLKSDNKNKEFYNENCPCYMPWYSVFITWDGWVNPCDFSCDNEITFGNVFKEPFRKIWNNKKYINFRKQVLSDRKTIPLCKNCGVDETYMEKEFEKFNKIPFLKIFRHKK